MIDIVPPIVRFTGPDLAIHGLPLYVCRFLGCRAVMARASGGCVRLVCGSCGCQLADAVNRKK